MTPEEHDHQDNVHDEEPGDDDMAELAGTHPYSCKFTDITQKYVNSSNCTQNNRPVVETVDIQERDYFSCDGVERVLRSQLVAGAAVHCDDRRVCASTFIQ